MNNLRFFLLLFMITYYDMRRDGDMLLGKAIILVGSVFLAAFVTWITS